MASLADAPQLKDVPEKISKMSQELGQFGSRLTGIETQVQTSKDVLDKVKKDLKQLPIQDHKDEQQELVGKVNTDCLQFLGLFDRTFLKAPGAKLLVNIFECLKHLNC